MSSNDNGDNEMIPGSVHRSPGMYLTAEENPQLGNRITKAVRSAIVTNGVLYLQMRLVGSHSTPGRKVKRKEQGYCKFLSNRNMCYS